MNKPIENKEFRQNVSAHYVGDKGKAYFRIQNEGGDQRGRINARKFIRYIHPDDVVLDFGCGGGHLFRHLDCQRKIGIEPNPSARKIAGPQSKIYDSLAAIEDSSVTVVISNHVLEHVKDPCQTLQDIASKLVSGGRLIMYLPVDDWRTQRKVESNNVDKHLYTWTPLLLGNLLGEAGYRVDTIKIYTHAWPPRWWRVLDRYLPVWLFDGICMCTSLVLKRRQVMAVATKI